MDLNEFIMGIDVGSSLIKCQIFDKLGNIHSKYSKEIEIKTPSVGHIEIDPIQLWNDFQEVSKKCVQSFLSKGSHLSLTDIRGIGISVQRNSFLLWERSTSKPLIPIISWQDTRSGSSVKSWNQSWKLKILNYSSKLAYFVTRNSRYLAASIMNFKTTLVSIRLLDILKSDPELDFRARSGEICYGCIETWLLWCLTDGKEFSTDATCASVTGICDPFTCSWSDTLLNLLNLPKEILPEIKNTAGNFGRTSPEFFGGNVSIPICCIIGDSQAATVGVGCFNKGEGKVTLGTGSFLNINTGDTPHVSMKGLYPEIGWKTNSKTVYFVEGGHPSTGSTLNWLKKLGFIHSYDELEKVMSYYSINSLFEEVYFVPAFMGLMAPINDPNAAGMLIGLSTTTLREAIIYAVMEAIPMTIRWILDTVQQETGLKLKSLRVNGSVAKNKWILQSLSNLTKLKIEVCSIDEASCMGAAFLAGLHLGFWKSFTDMSDICTIEEVYHPDNTSYEKLECKFRKWKSACDRSRNWRNNDNC